MLVGRARKLERLGLAAPLGPGQWIMAEEAESVLRKLGERGDIIKRIHRGLAERGAERAAADFVLDGETRGDPIIGRLLARGLDDELKGSAFAVIDGIDGRAHHLRLDGSRRGERRRDRRRRGSAAPAIARRRIVAPRPRRALRSFDRGSDPRGGRDLARSPPRRQGAHAPVGSGLRPRGSATRWRRAPSISSLKAWRAGRASASSSPAIF